MFEPRKEGFFDRLGLLTLALERFVDRPKEAISNIAGEVEKLNYYTDEVAYNEVPDEYKPYIQIVGLLRLMEAVGTTETKTIINNIDKAITKGPPKKESRVQKAVKNVKTKFYDKFKKVE